MADLKHLTIGSETYDIPTDSLGSDFIIRDGYTKSITLAAGATTLNTFTTTNRADDGYTCIACILSAGTQYYNLENVSGTATGSVRIRITSTRSSSTTANVSVTQVWVKSDYVTQNSTTL